MTGTLTFGGSISGASDTGDTDAVGISFGSGLTLATASDVKNRSNSNTGTANTWTAIEMGSVSAGAAHWVALRNLSASDDIEVAIDVSGTKHIFDTLQPGHPPHIGFRPSQIYVRCVLTADVPYAAFVMAA
jgi:hypothetical protein